MYMRHFNYIEKILRIAETMKTNEQWSFDTSFTQEKILTHTHTHHLTLSNKTENGEKKIKTFSKSGVYNNLSNDRIKRLKTLSQLIYTMSEMCRRFEIYMYIFILPVGCVDAELEKSSTRTINEFNPVILCAHEQML